MSTLNIISSKIVLLGEASVGKSSCVERFVKNEFFEYQQPTIGAAFLTQSVRLDEENVEIKFEIWDTAGQERYHSLAPMYYRGAAAALVVYDITSAESFQRAQAWIEELQRQGATDIVIGLAGNKCDLETRREVTQEEAKEFSHNNNCIFYETSAKSGTNILTIFKAIASALPKQDDVVASDSIQIVNTDKKSNPCC